MIKLIAATEVIIDVPIEYQLEWFTSGMAYGIGFIVTGLLIRIFRKLGSESVGLGD